MDLARLGAEFPLAGIGLVGADADGEWIHAQCAAQGIDSTGVRVQPGSRTSYTDVMTVRSTGRRTFFHQRGANAFLGAEHFDFARNAKIFHLGYLLLLDRLDEPDGDFGTAAARVLHRAREAGYKTSVDVVSEDSHRFAEIVLPALRHVDYCILNEFEAERTTGITTRTGGAIDWAALERVCQRLLDEGVREWIIIHFPEGACAMGADRVFHSQGSVLVPQSAIVSAVGAGDAFVAGMLHGLHDEAPIEEALGVAVSAAASCLFGAGTSDGIQPLAECLALKEKFGTRSRA